MLSRGYDIKSLKQASEKALVTPTSARTHTHTHTHTHKRALRSKKTKNNNNKTRKLAMQFTSQKKGTDTERGDQ